MAHKLQKIYNAFGGLDTRSNKLQMDPKTLRNGSKNFRFDFQDQWTKANGFQRKAITSGFTVAGDIEYKYTDLNTGAAKTQYICVSTSGLLYRRDSHYLSFSNIGLATKYSYYYDEVLNSFVFKMDTYPAISVSETMTLSQLRDAINLLGPTTTIVSESGAVLATSSKLAYFINVILDYTLFVGKIPDISSWFWTQVEYPSVGNIFTQVPFPITKNNFQSSNYEGISYQNLNNVCYITDGGFPMKYDGYSVARAGMAKILKPATNSTSNFIPGQNLSNFFVTPVISSGGKVAPEKTYKYAFQHGYVDYQGSTVLGAYEVAGTNLYVGGKTSSTNSFSIVHTGLTNEPNFPIYSCTINGPQNLLDAGGTINVGSEHNIKVGMLLRIPVNNALVGLSGFSYLMSYVSAVTSTTITLDFGLTSATLYPFQASPQSLAGQRVASTNVVNLMGNVVTCNTTIGSKIITGLASTAAVLSGDEIFSTLFTSGTRVVSVDSLTQVTVNAAATATQVGHSLSINYGVRAVVGSLVVGSGIPANTFVTAVSGNGSTITLSNNATTTSNSFLTITRYPSLLIDGQVLNGGYAQDIYKNKVSNPNYDFGFCPDVPFGAFTRVFRTTADGDTPYRLIDVPLQRSGIPGTFLDNFEDGNPQNPASLSRISLDDSDQGGDLPRACKYLTQWQGQLVQCGRPVDPTVKDLPYPTFYGSAPINIWGSQETTYFGYIYSEASLCDDQSIFWSDSLTPEGFPQDGLHEFRIESSFNDKITGASQNKDALFTFKERSTGVLVGTLSENNLTLEILESDVGCTAHRSIQDVQGSLVWLDKSNGFYSCVAGRLPVHIGWPISDYQQINKDDLDFNKAVSCNFRKESLYICAVGSTTFVFDYASTSESYKPRNAWYVWDRLDTKSLTSSANDELLLCDGSYTWKMKVTNTKYDDTDHTSAIEAVFNTAWLMQNFPTIDKHYINLWINSVQGGFSLTVKQYGNYLEDEISSMDNVSFKSELDSKKAVKVSVKSAMPKLSSVSFGLINSEKNKDLRIQGIEVEYSGDFDSGEPKI